MPRQASVAQGALCVRIVYNLYRTMIVCHKIGCLSELQSEQLGTGLPSEFFMPMFTYILLMPHPAQTHAAFSGHSQGVQSRDGAGFLTIKGCLETWRVHFRRDYISKSRNSQRGAMEIATACLLQSILFLGQYYVNCLEESNYQFSKESLTGFWCHCSGEVSYYIIKCI